MCFYLLNAAFAALCDCILHWLNTFTWSAPLPHGHLPPSFGSECTYLKAVLSEVYFLFFIFFFFHFYLLTFQRNYALSEVADDKPFRFRSESSIVTHQ